MLNNGEINNLKSFLNLIKFYKKRLFISTFLFVFAGIVYIYLSDTYYESTITLYPAGELYENYDNIFEQYETMSESLGLNINSKSNYYIPDIIVSYSLKKKIIQNKWNTFNTTESTNLIDFWKLNKPSFLSKIKDNFRDKFYDEEINQINNAIETLDNLIKVDEKNSGLIEFTVYMQEPQLAVDVANFISDYVVSFVNNQQTTFAKKNKIFIDKELKKADKSLKDAENILTEFRKKHPVTLDTPDLQLKRLQYTRDVEIKKSVLETLTKQQIIANLEESKERLFINIISEATINVNKSHPKIIVIIILSFILGYIISLLSLITVLNIRNSLYENKS